MNGHEAQALRRIEAQLGMLLRHVETVDCDLRERLDAVEDEAARAYRRGYSAGFAASARGAPHDPDTALTKRRRSR